MRCGMKLLDGHTFSIPPAAPPPAYVPKECPQQDDVPLPPLPLAAHMAPRKVPHRGVAAAAILPPQAYRKRGLEG